MVILDDFQFSQASLQDFVDCKRRFYYRYVHKLSWPAIENEPALLSEQWMQLGAAFHRLAQQLFLGIEESLLTDRIRGDNLRVWWKNFLENMPVNPNHRKYPERILATKIGDNILLAKFDLIVVDSTNSVWIYDWKTSQKSGSRHHLENKLQTKVYPYVLSKAGGSLIGETEISPERIKMVYWYVNLPESSETFYYNSEQMISDEQVLSTLITEILSLQEISDYPLIKDDKRCRYCIYRSLCDRGSVAGPFQEFDVDVIYELEAAFDFDQIPEIEF